MGLEEIKKAIYKLGAKHAEHIAVYGEGNELRLTGKFETASIDQFCYGVANRGASIRIGRDTEKEGKGYFEDRRPSSNCDPYVVTGKIMDTIMGPAAVPIAPSNREEASVTTRTPRTIKKSRPPAQPNTNKIESLKEKYGGKMNTLKKKNVVEDDEKSNVSYDFGDAPMQFA